MEDNKFAQVEHLIAECRNVERHCRIKAQTHFHMARVAARQNLCLVLFPAVIAAIAGSISATGLLPHWAQAINAITALASSIVAVSTIIGIDRSAGVHIQAGNAMTRLRHEARFLHETLWRELSRDQLCAEARRINDRYGELIQLLPITSEKAWKTVEYLATRSAVPSPPELRPNVSQE